MILAAETGRWDWDPDPGFGLGGGGRVSVNCTASGPQGGWAVGLRQPPFPDSRPRALRLCSCFSLSLLPWLCSLLRKCFPFLKEKCSDERS